jgi:hypothetical protein
VKSSKVFSTKEAPTVAAYFDLKDGQVEGFKVEDDKRKICDKELACKKISFVWKRKNGADEITAWLSPEIRAGGLAALTLKGKATGATKNELETTIKLECGGCGTADKKDMGETAEDLLDGDLLAEPEEVLELPFNPFAKVKKGEWAAIRLDVDEGSRSETAVGNYEVIKAGKETVEIEATLKGNRGHDDSHTLEFSKGKAPNALEYLGRIIKGSTPRGDAPKVTGVKIVDEKKKVGDREFDCKKITFSFMEHTTRIKVKMWMSPDAKVMGLVAAELRIKERGGEVSIDMELGGFGDDEKTEWGKTAEQLTKKKKKKADDE